MLGRDQRTNKELAEGAGLGIRRLLHGLPLLACELPDLPKVDVSAAAVHHSLKEQDPVTSLWSLVPDLALLDRFSKVPGKAQEVCWQEIIRKTSMRSLRLLASDSSEQTVSSSDN